MADRDPVAPLEHDEQGRIGPGPIRRIGPYQQDRILSGSRLYPWPAAHAPWSWAPPGKAGD